LKLRNINLNDNCVEGMRHCKLPVFSFNTILKPRLAQRRRSSFPALY